VVQHAIAPSFAVHFVFLKNAIINSNLHFACIQMWAQLHCVSKKVPVTFSTVTWKPIIRLMIF